VLRSCGVKRGEIIALIVGALKRTVSAAWTSARPTLLGRRLQQHPPTFASGIRVYFPSSEGKALHAGGIERMDDPVIWLLEDRQLAANRSRADLNDPTGPNLERERRIGSGPYFLPGAPLVAGAPRVALGWECKSFHVPAILHVNRGVSTEYRVRKAHRKIYGIDRMNALARRRYDECTGGQN
jgi:hypothetical protein